MKKFFYLFALLAIFACEEQNTEEVAYLNIDDTLEIFEAEGGSFELGVTSNVDWWATVDTDWVTLSAYEYTGSLGVTVSVDPTESMATEFANVVFSADGLESKTLRICRNGQESVDNPSMELAESTLTAAADGGIITASLITNIAWVATTECEWIYLDATEGIGTTEISIAVDPTTSYNVSTATVTFSDISSDAEVTLTINREGQIAPEGTEYRRRSLVTKFTATWCGYCPSVSAVLDEIRESDPNMFVEIAMHYDDNFPYNHTVTYANAWGVSGFPSVIIDMNNTSYFYSGAGYTAYTYKSAMAKSQAANPTVVGIQASVEMDASNTVSVDIDTDIQADGNYKIICAYTKSGYAYTQSGGTSDYRQNHVLLDFLQSASFGDELKSGGCLNGDKVSTSYSLVIDDLVDEADADNVSFVIVVLNEVSSGVYYVNNAIECGIGETKFYEYAE